jgi:hypothetical protein
MRAAAALKSLGFERRTERREDSGAGTRKPQKVWVRP